MDGGIMLWLLHLALWDSQSNAAGDARLAGAHAQDLQTPARSSRAGRRAPATERPCAAVPLALSAGQWRALCALRARYACDRDLLSDGERARLRFLCWLRQAGRLSP